MFGFLSFLSSKESPSPEELAEMPLVVHTPRSNETLMTEEGFRAEMKEIKDTMQNFGCGIRAILERIDRLEIAHNAVLERNSFIERSNVNTPLDTQNSPDKSNLPVLLPQTNSYCSNEIKGEAEKLNYNLKSMDKSTSYHKVQYDVYLYI